jgi:hypothetical protein
MTKYGMLISTMFGGIGFVVLGLWGALQCSVSWVGHASLLCGGVFILLGPVGYVAGLAVYWLLRTLMRVLTGGPANTDGPRF